MHKEPRDLRELRESKCPPAASWVPVDPLRLLLGSSTAAPEATRVATAVLGASWVAFQRPWSPKIVDSVRDVLQNTHIEPVSKIAPFWSHFGRYSEALGATGSQDGPLWIAFGIPLESLYGV